MAHLSRKIADERVKQRSIGPAEMIQIRPATADEAAEITNLLRQIATWLQHKGEPLWNPESFTTSLVQSGIERGDWILAKQGAILAGIVLRQTEDPEGWPDRKPGDAFYLHKLCVSRAFAGQGVSRKLIEWLSQSAHSLGHGYLRLDCAPRPALLNLYPSLGFKLVDQRLIGGHPTHRFERKIR
jgi:GNAT superfamily N-acetyltransferase